MQTFRYHAIILSILIYSMQTPAQEYSKDFNKIAKAEIDLQQHPNDKEAEAVVLFDKARSYFVESAGRFEIIFERTTRIKIFNQAGYKWSEIEIPFYREGSIYEKVFDIEAFTFNLEEGKITRTPLDMENIYDEKINDRWTLKKFAMPNVKDGSIIDVKYKISSQYVYNLRDWEFQWEIPVFYSEYQVQMIPFYTYAFLLQGASKFDSYETYVLNSTRRFAAVDYQDLVHRYIMEDLPAFKDAEFISSKDDYIIKLDFQLAQINQPNGTQEEIITTWEAMIKDLLKEPEFYKFVRKVEKSAPELLSADLLIAAGDEARFNGIMNYVKANYSWNGSYGKYASKSLSRLLSEKVGTSADINLFTLGLLRGAEIEAYPVIISTRDHGKIKYDYPFSHFFNYVIILAYINGEPVLTDGTEVLGLNDRLPVRCINDKGLVIKKDGVEWVNLKSSNPSRKNTTLEMSFTDEMKLSTNIVISATEYDALYYRKKTSGDLDELKDILRYNQEILIDSSLTTENRFDIEKPYLIKYSLLSEPEIIGSKIYFSPFLNEILDDNPLKQKERKYPLDMIYPKMRSYVSTIAIPQGYQVEHLPEEFTVKNSLFELNYQAVADEKNITLTFKYYFKEGVYPVTDYSKIKYYFRQIVKKGNEKVVLSEIE